jgi:hypothetical protein
MSFSRNGCANNFLRRLCGIECHHRKGSIIVCARPIIRNDHTRKILKRYLSLRSLDFYRMFFRLDKCPIRVRVNLDEFCVKEQDLRGIVDPFGQKH